ncbi:MAG: hypothetical protein IJR52_10855 [Selenomonadaceae bacterium]|nr:hypothetical protein [Selenomonadaceae bacterium]MBQ9498055.1 hypothetical protein [Selenomonadaceae bacterium]
MRIIPTKYFKNDVKFYVRKKKFLKIDADVKTVTDELEQGNLVGDKLDNLNLPANTAAYKVRVANSSTNVGKSDGFKIIYYVVIEEKIYLATIYSKKDDSRVPSDKQIELLIRAILQEEE